MPRRSPVIASPLAGLLGLAAFSFCWWPFHAAVAEPGWQAGAAGVIITPEHPMRMAGLASNKPSRGTIHDLYAKALALQGPHGTRLVIVTMDLCMIPMVLRERMEREVARRFGLPPEGLLLNASHTHSGPETRPKRAAVYGFPPEAIDEIEQYLVWLEGRLIHVIDDALGTLAPVKLGFTRDRATFARNRRLKTAGGYRMGLNPDGVVDHDVPVLQVRSLDGRLRAVVFGYACHATAFITREYCGDYPGFAQRAVEAAHPGAAALFLTGCAGDQRPRKSGALKWAKQWGRELGEAVERALDKEPAPVEGPLAAALKRVELQLDAPPSRDELVGQSKALEGIPRRRAEMLLERFDTTGELPETYPCYLQVIRFGDGLLLAALGWEVVVDYALRLKQEVDDTEVWVAGYSNEIFNYLPSARVLAEGGYEAGGSLLHYTLAPARLAPSVESRVVGTVRALAAKTAAVATRRQETPPGR